MEKNKADKVGSVLGWEGMAVTFEQDLEKRREQTADSKPLM